MEQALSRQAASDAVGDQQRSLRCRMPARTAASTRSRGPRALAGSGSSRTRAATTTPSPGPDR